MMPCLAHQMISIDHIPGIIPLKLTPWATADNRLIADVSSFGFGGSNVHATVEKYRFPAQAEDDGPQRPISILPLSASSDEALFDLAAKYVSYCRDEAESFVDTCFTAATGRQHFASRLAVPCSSLQEAVAGLSEFIGGGSMKTTPKTMVGKVEGNTDVVMMFTGQGSQLAGMGRELYDTYPAFKEQLDECATLLKPHLDRDLLTILFPAPGDEDLINATIYTQPALFAVEYSLAQLYMSWGVEAAAVVGHSVGEYVAACVAGVFSLGDGLKLIAARARLMDSVSEKGSMAAVFATKGEVEQAISRHSDVSDVVIAAVNGPKSIVISGRKAAVTKVLDSFKAAKVRCVALNTSNAFHSPVMDPILDEFEKIASGVTYGEPFTALVLNRTGKLCDASSIPDAAYWRDHLRNAVLFADCMETLHSSGYKLYVEVGPQPQLIGMARRILSDDKIKWIESMQKGKSEVASVSKGLSSLYVNGASVNWVNFEKPYKRTRALLPPYAFQHQKKHWPTRMKIGQAMIANPSAYSGRPSAPATQPVEADGVLFDVTWRALPDLPAETATADAGAWLVLADAGGLGAAFADQVTKNGGKAVLLYSGNAPYGSIACADPLKEADMVSAISQCAGKVGRLSYAVDFWAVDSARVADATASDISASAMQGCGHSLLLMRALLSEGESPSMWFVTRGAQPVSPGPVEVAQSPLWSFARVISMEQPALWGGLIDIDPGMDSKAQVPAIYGEIASSAGEDHVGLRGSARYGTRITPSAPVHGGTKLRADAAYLVTGGLGGVLQNVVKWMAEAGARKFILTSRGGLPPKSQWDAVSESPAAENIKFVRHMEGLGAEVEVVAVDVCDANAMKKVCMSAPIAGIVHGAGVMTAEVMETMPLLDLEKVLKPKVLGSMILHSITEQMPVQPDFFIMFSSISAVWGSNQLAHYAAANHFCDALAHHRRSMGKTALSIDWGLLAGGGMSAHENVKFSEAMGLRSLEVEEYTSIMGQLISADAVQKVAVGINWSKFKDIYQMRGTKPLLAEVGPKKSNTNDESAALKDLFGSIPKDKLGEHIVSLCLQAADDTVGNADFPLDAPLMESGMDSMMAVDFRNALCEKLGGMKLSETLMFDYPTLGKVAEYIAGKIKAIDFDAISDQPAAGSVPSQGSSSGGGGGMVVDTNISVIGVAGTFPDSPNLKAYWNTLTNARDAIREIPWERWDVTEFFDANPNAIGNFMYAREAGFMSNAQAFDAKFFGIAPTEVYAMDPQQRLLLDVGMQSLSSAGFTKSSVVGVDVGVFVGVGSPDFRDASARDQVPIGAYSATGSAMCISANRISYALDLKGPSIALDTACSSALTAVSLGCQSLTLQQSSFALCEGVNLLLAPTTFVATSKARMLSPTSRCKTFDAAADGYVRGEGCGAVVLALTSQLQSGQKSFCSLRAASLNQDGRTATLTAPNGPSQQKVIANALGHAGITGADVDYIESHGTGTPLGDPIEVMSLKEVLNNRHVILGAVKSNIGHLEAAAGIASMVKAIIALQQRCVPQNLHFTKLNPIIERDGFDMQIPTTKVNLRQRSIAGVSSFGFGGTNAHVILQGDESSASAVEQGELVKYNQQVFRWGDVVHPLVGAVPKSSAEQVKEWITTWDKRTVDTLCGHRVGRVSLVPATCYIEMVTPVVHQLYGDVPFTLENLEFVNILYLSARTTPRVRISLDDENGIKIESETRGQWTLHATMNLIAGSKEEVHAPLDIAAMQARCTDVRQGGDAFYEKIGNDYQGHFRSVSKVWLGQDELLACVEVDSDELQGRPDLCACAWLDACTQAGVLRMDHGGRPFYAAKAGVYAVGSTDRRLQKRLWSVMKQAAPGGRKGRIDIYNDLGDWLVSIVGNEAGFFDRGYEPASVPVQALYESKWEASWDTSASPSSKLTVLGQQGQEQFCSELAQGCGSSFDVNTCFDANGLAGDSSIVVCIAALFNQGAVDAMDAVLSLTQVVGKSRPIWIVTRGSQSVEPADMTDAAMAHHAGLWGFARTARAEGYDIKCIDVDPASAAPADVAADLIKASVVSAAETEVAVRAGQTQVSRLVTCESKLKQPIELHMPSRGALANLVVRPLSASSRRAPGPGEVELRVRAVGLNFRDVLNVMGLYPGDPGPPGGDCSGTVVRVGEGVTHLAVGDHAFGIEGGCMKAFVTGNAHLLARKPPSMSFAEAASMPIIWLTVELAFGDPVNPGIQSKYNLKRGDKVLIHAATGGVGLVAVAYAQRVGAIVYATAGRSEKHDFLRKMGVKFITTSRDAGVFSKDMNNWVGPGGIDVVLNCLADDYIPESLALLRKGGRFMEIGKRAIWTQEEMRQKRPDVLYEPIAADVLLTTNPPWFSAQLERMVEQVENGLLEAVPNKCFDMETSGIEALRFLQQAQHIGKVVMTIPSSMNVSSDVAYVITGGMGALGLSVARRMIEEGACNLVLLSRSGKPAPANADKWTWLQECSANVLSRRCDVSKKSSIANVLAQLNRTGIVVRGVIHAAGVLEDAPLEKQSRGSFERVFAPKVDGAWYLHEETVNLGMDLDFFIMFSSISSLFGSTAQANYSAANACLDGLARHRHANGLPAVSIQWGAWTEAGMAAERDTIRRLEGMGIDGLTTEYGLTALSSLVTSSASCAAVVPVQWPKFLEQFAGVVPAFLEHVAESVDEDDSGATGAASGALAELQAAPAGDRFALTQALVLSMATQVMGQADIPVDEPLMEAGMDSLSAVEFRNALAAKLRGIDLSDTIMYDYPSIKALSEYIVEQVGTAAPSAESGAASSVVTVAAGSGTSPPFFCVQGAGRGDFLYQEIARSLGKDQAFYELRHAGLAYDGIDELALRLARDITKAAPTGPIVIGGWSFGGLLAFEICKKLQKQRSGPRVVKLVLIDWVEKGMAMADHDPAIGAIGALIRSVELGAGKKLSAAVLDAAVAQIKDYSFEDKFDHAFKLLETNGLLSSTDAAVKAELLSSVRSFEQAISAMLRHGGQTQAADVAAFAGQQNIGVLALSSSNFGLFKMERFDWSAASAADNVRVDTIDGDHWEILRKPAVGKLGTSVKIFLKEGAELPLLSTVDSMDEKQLKAVLAAVQRELARK